MNNPHLVFHSNIPFNGVLVEGDWLDLFDKNFFGGGDDFCSVGDGDDNTVVVGDAPFENRVSERIEKKIEIIGFCLIYYNIANGKIFQRIHSGDLYLFWFCTYKNSLVINDLFRWPIFL